MISLQEIKNKEIAIFGTGLEAVKCAYDLYNEGITIKYYLNNDIKVDTFLNSPVYCPRHKQIEDGIYILVAVETVSTYLKISNQLKEFSFEEFKDYIFYKWINKKVVLLHGNCHMRVIQSYLESSRSFVDCFALYPNPLICENEDKVISENVLKNCDVWIHEDIRKENMYGYFLSDEYLREIFQGRGMEIIVPHLFGLGKAFFPQSSLGNKKNRAIANGVDQNGMFPHTDRVIDKCVEEGMNIEDVILFCKGSFALSKKVIIENFYEYMNKIQEREKEWDIKIYEFIKENYKKEKLFYDEGHPTNIIFKKICMDILCKLEIQEDSIDTSFRLDAYENPIYPVVAQILGLEWCETEIRTSPYGRKMRDKMNFEEYIREYVWWRYRN